jgi:hypothetical protein
VFVPALAFTPAGFFAVGLFRFGLAPRRKFDRATRRKRKTRRNRRAEAAFIYSSYTATVNMRGDWAAAQF